MDLFLSFLAGMFAINSVPHLVQGVSGKSFRTPFVRLSGTKQSGPVVNVAWGWFNAAVAYWLAVHATANFSLMAFALGTLLMGLAMAMIFAGDH